MTPRSCGTTQASWWMIALRKVARMMMGSSSLLNILEYESIILWSTLIQAWQSAAECCRIKGNILFPVPYDLEAGYQVSSREPPLWSQASSESDLYHHPEPPSCSLLAHSRRSLGHHLRHNVQLIDVWYCVTQMSLLERKLHLGPQLYSHRHTFTAQKLYLFPFFSFAFLSLLLHS